MSIFFRAYKILSNGSNISAYFIESTATENVEDAPLSASVSPADMEKIEENDVIPNIIDYLMSSNEPNLVISIHGFNTPRDIAIERYRESFQFVSKDDAINSNNTICIGYRWPSESMFSSGTIRTIWNAAPKVIYGSFITGIILISISIIFHIVLDMHEAVSAIFGIFFLTIAIALVLLRIVVYFRDGYRARFYAVPDLIEIIRQIDKKWKEESKDSTRRINLSFIGHSMGGYVVTDVVRILSDVFSPQSIRDGLDAKKDPTPPSHIGNAFCLKRLVLISPDIPAEALISHRANFLASSLRRFEEAYLFSNEGDEVLRQISRTANYFSFPTGDTAFGHRLGNIAVLSENYGIESVKTLGQLAIGNVTLDTLYNRLVSVGQKNLSDDYTKCFSYFDCTDCVDENGKAYLSRAEPGRGNKTFRFGHLSLLIHYLWNRDPDVHGGYFKSPFLRELIHRMACLGRERTEEAYGGFAGLDKQCRNRQIKVLLAQK